MASPSVSVSPSTSPVSTKTYTFAEVAKHKTEADCWTTIGGNVFEITPFIKLHPGGIPNISKVCGIDATALFTAQHGSTPNAQKALASLKIGVLAGTL